MSDEAAERVSPVEGDAAAVAMTRSSRRDVMKAGVAVVGGVAAASYVKPSLTVLGVPAALAISGGGGSNNCWISCTPIQVEKDIDTLLKCLGGGFPIKELVEIFIEELSGSWSGSWSTNSDDNGDFQVSFSCMFPSAGSYKFTATCNSPLVARRALTTLAGTSTTVSATTTITAV